MQPQRPPGQEGHASECGSAEPCRGAEGTAATSGIARLSPGRRWGQCLRGCWGPRIVWDDVDRARSECRSKCKLGRRKGLSLRWQPWQHKCEASPNIRSFLSRAPGCLALGCTADVGYLAVSMANKATRLMELALWCRDRQRPRRQMDKPDSFRTIQMRKEGDDPQKRGHLNKATQTPWGMGADPASGLLPEPPHLIPVPVYMSLLYLSTRLLRLKDPCIIHNSQKVKTTQKPMVDG